MKQNNITTFGFQPGKILARKYEVISRLGGGWEGEVYKIKERVTGVERTAKFFFPNRDAKNKKSILYAKKLHKLRRCPILIQYHTQEVIRYNKQDLAFLVSEYVEGELLSDLIKKSRGKRLHWFEALHLLYALTQGIEQIHNLQEYHGDIHSENIIVKRSGLGFDVKVIDLFHWGGPKRENIGEDVVNLIKVFYEAIGGKYYYSKQPPIVKKICCGLKRTKILKQYNTAGKLRRFLETLEW